MLLIIDDVAANEIKELKLRAENNPTSLEEVKELIEKGPPPGRINEDFTIFIPINVCVTYTYEYQTNNVLCRHLSMSIGDGDKVSGKTAAQTILNAFDFVNSVDQLLENKGLWVEALRDNTRAAINFLEPVSGDFEELRPKKICGFCLYQCSRDGLTHYCPMCGEKIKQEERD